MRNGFKVIFPVAPGCKPIATALTAFLRFFMPELPEVESIRRSLEPRLLGRAVRSATLHRRDVLVLPGDPFGGFARQRGAARHTRPRRARGVDLLADADITALHRHGKQLALMASTGHVLVVQLGMSGQLFHRAAGERVPDTTHIHATWRFDDGRLIFRDPRRFGGLRALPTTHDLQQLWSTLGPDALTINPDALSASLADAARPLKAALLDQSLIAGVGNIYADEALHLARLSPTRSAAQLSASDTTRLATAIRQVIAHAIEAGGSTLRDYVDANGDPGTYQLSHAVYGRGGQPCTRCGKTLRSTILAQRTTVWCPHCQT